MPSLRYLAAVATGSAAVVTALLTEKLKLSANCNENHAAYGGERKWDYDWDKMSPSEIKDTDEGTERPAKSKVTRTLILIRHGQYVWDPIDPNKRVLTELGRKQAAITGQRLKELGLKYTTIYYSTMPRATETYQIMQQSLPGVAAQSCDLMREGAPIRPEPMGKKWRPESHVRC